MSIVDGYKRGGLKVSAEFFPPKNYQRFFRQIEMIQDLGLHFVSVTSHAHIPRSAQTLTIAAIIREEYGLETFAHMTCRYKEPEQIDKELILHDLVGNKNLVALLGDRVDEGKQRYKHADELVQQIRETGNNQTIAVAGYPEGYKGKTPEEDISWLKQKIDLGADMVLLQMCFDPKIYGQYLQLAQEAGIDKPIVPGILPLTSEKFLDRILTEDRFGYPTIPQEYVDRLRSAEDIKAEGIQIAIEIILEMQELGAPGVHLYGMNSGQIIKDIVEGLPK